MATTVQTWLNSLFGLRREDWRKLWLMGPIFLLAGISEMLNYTSFMAMFNSRAGTQYLPVMYLVEAFVLPLEGWLLSYLTQRLPKPRFMLTMYLLFVGVILLNGVWLVAFEGAVGSGPAYYFQLYLLSNFVVRQQTLLMWSTAFDLCPTQQAKRIMPAFVVCAIVGGIAAGLISNTLAPYLGPELLYLLAAFILLSGFPNFIKAIKQYLVPLTFMKGPEEEDEEPTEEAAGASWTYYFKETLRSPFLIAVIGIMTLMPAAYFLMEYQYFTSAQAAFPTEAEVTAFYGMMVIVLFCLALVLQLFSARLMDRIGASNTILAISFVFLGSFLVVGAFVDSGLALAAVSMGYCFTYLLLYYFAEPSYQFFFKMLPLKHRDGFRFTAQGIAASAGILLGSLLSMLHSELDVSLSTQALVGSAVAAVLVLAAWATRRLYIKELVRHLHAGAAVIRNMLADFIESMRNDRVRETLVKQLDHPNEAIQRLTLELYAANPDPAVTEPLLQFAERRSGAIKAQAVAAIHPDGWKAADRSRRRALLTDPDEAVRRAAFRREAAAAAEAGERAQLIELGLADADVFVRVEALRVMDESERLYELLRGLLAQGGDAAALACGVIGERRIGALFYDVMMCLLDPSPAVRIAAVRAIGRIGDGEAATSLMDLLIGADLELRAAIEQALVEIGESGLPVLTRFIASPNDDIWRAVIGAVNAFGTDRQIEELLVPACVERLAALGHSHGIVRLLRASGAAEHWIELAERRSEELTGTLLDTIWRVLTRLGDERSIPELRRAVESRDEELRDHGLEILSEGIGNGKLSAALYAYYKQRYQADKQEGAASEGERDELLKGVTDPWLQAIAVKAGLVKGETDLIDNWEYLSTLDKIVFLKQVPLLKEVSVEQLGRVAGIARERTYEDGEYLMEQGKPGRALFIIVEGNVEVSGRSEDGTEGTIGVLGPLQTIGEAGLFDDRPSMVSAQAVLDKARVLEIQGEEAARLVRLYPDIGVALLRSLSGRLRQMEHMLLSLG